MPSGFELRGGIVQMVLRPLRNKRWLKHHHHYGLLVPSRRTVCALTLSSVNVQLCRMDSLRVSLVSCCPPAWTHNQCLSPLLQNLLMFVLAKPHAQITPCFTPAYILADRRLWNESIATCETTERYSRRKRKQQHEAERDLGTSSSPGLFQSKGIIILIK